MMFSDWLTPVAWAQDGGGATQAGGSPLPIILMFGVIAAVWWWIMIRPQQRRDKERRSMIDSLRKGDTIITAGGIHARVFAVEEQVVRLELGKDVRFDCDKNAIVARIGDDDGPKEKTAKK